MADPARRNATYADVLAAPEHEIAEIIDGDLYTQPRPSLPHAEVASELNATLRASFGRRGGGPGGWVILLEPELHLRRDILVPDIAGWRRERLPHVPNAAFVTLAPDWACEVLSKRTANVDRVKKLRIYARENVRHVWLVDPLEQVLEVFRLENERYSLLGAHAGDERVRAEPFDAIEIELAMLWADIEPEPQ